MKKAGELMRTAQIEKTRQTMQRLIEWYADKEQFYKQYLPIQEAIIGNTVTAANITIERLKQMAQMMKEEK
jgi:ABC-type iron transport system FetAB permease component